MKKKIGLILLMLLIVPSLAIATDAVTNIKFGGEVRLRGYEFDNFWSFYDESYYYGTRDRWSTFRLRTQLFASADVGDNITGYVRLANQTYGEGVGDYEDNKGNKVFIDNAYINVKGFWAAPLELTLGRQNMLYGSGFVLFDGQSQMASTSMYFDGVKGTINFSDQIKLDLFYMVDQENNRENQYPNYYTYEYNGDDIYLYGGYLTINGALAIGGKQEVYAMSKKTQYLGRDIKTFGLRLSDKFDLGFDYSLEAAKQFGTAYDWGYYGRVDQEAFGCKADLGFTFNGVDIKPRLFGQFALMTGDEDDTDGTCEEWDVVYGGWPQFGDLLAWTFVNAPPNRIVGYDETYQTGEAAYRNILLYTAGINFTVGSVTPKFSYTKIKADETEAYGLDDDDLGDYYQFSMGYQYSKALSFALYYAMIQPGDEFTDSGSCDDAYEFFWEAKVKF